MKRKIITSSLIGLLVFGVSLSLIFNHKSIAPQVQSIPVENKEIIAPAIIDSLNDITRVPTLQSGIVTKIHVTVGQMVKKGQALFSLDNRAAKHEVIVNKITLKQAENNLIIQTKNLKRAKAQLERLKKLDTRTYTRSELRDRVHEIKMGTIQLEQTQYNLDITKIRLAMAERALKQYTTVAPKDGIVLQINTHVNEFIGGAHQVVFLGDARKIIVRISIDERDLKNFTPDAHVYLTNNEDPNLKIPLTFVQLDRYIIYNERYNSRVQEALYFFNRDDYPSLVAGQQLDAHIAFKLT